MKRLFQVFVSLCIIVAVNGCTIPETCMLYNNIGQDIKIIRLKTDGSITEQKVKARSTVKLKWGFSTYRIVGEDTIWDYDLVKPDVDFVFDAGFDRLFKVQLEKGGHIYILQPDQSFPASKFPKQPEGFPLLPK